MASSVESLAALYARDLAAVGREVDAYADDVQPWVVVPGLPNVGGTLVLHVCGNLRHYVGAVLGGSGYVRDRPMEFSTHDVSRQQLGQIVNSARAEVARALSAIDPAILQIRYPERVGPVLLTTGDFLFHLVSHLAYHLGQLDYHRRVVTRNTSSIVPVNLRELASAQE